MKDAMLNLHMRVGLIYARELELYRLCIPCQSVMTIQFRCPESIGHLCTARNDGTKTFFFVSNTVTWVLGSTF